MRVCPVCGATYSAAHEFCPMDGSALRESHAPSAVMTIAGADIDTSSTGSEKMIGRILDERYRLEELIGSGGMGVVYRATHVVINKPVAIKVLRDSAARNPDVVQRFLLEAQLASSLDHENVVDISDYGQLPEGTAYYVMEFLPGHSLADEIDGRGKLDPQRALKIAVQIGRGLAAAHSHNIVHRDLKPDNVYLCPASGGAEEHVKLLDFGIARVEGRKTRLTAVGAVVGTPEYMSPEQAQGSEVDYRTDLYALGTILFEMITGRVPFRGDTALGTLTKQMFDPPPALREVEPELVHMPRLEAVVAKLLAKHRDDRPASAEDAVRVLTDALSADLHGSPSSSHRAKATVAMGSDALSDSSAYHHVVGAPGAGLGPMTAGRGGDRDSPSVIMRRGGDAAHITAEIDASRFRPGLASPPVTLLVVGTTMFAALITAGIIVRVNREAPTPSKAPVQAPVSVTEPAPEEPRRVTLRFLSKPEGAEVLEGGKTVLGVTPFSQDVDRAKRMASYLFRLDGHSDVVRQVGLDRDRSLSVELVALPAAATPAPVEAPEKDATQAKRRRTKRPTKTTSPVGDDATPTDIPPAPRANPPPRRPPARPMTRGDLKDPFGPK